MLVDLPHDLLVRILRASPSLQLTMICLRICKALAHAAADDSVWFSLRGGKEDASTKQPDDTIPGENLTNRLSVCISASVRAIRRHQKSTVHILGSDDPRPYGEELSVEQWARLATDIFSVCQARNPWEPANVLLALRHDTAVCIACVVEDQMIKVLQRSLLMASHRCRDPAAADLPGGALRLPGGVFKAYPTVLLTDVLLAVGMGHVEQTNFFGSRRQDWRQDWYPARADEVLGKLFRTTLTEPSLRLLRCLARRAGIVRISWNALECCWCYLLSQTAHAVMRASAVAWTTSSALAQLDALDAACERVNAELCVRAHAQIAPSSSHASRRPTRHRGHEDDDHVEEEEEEEEEEQSFADELSFSFFDNPQLLQPGAFMSEIPIPAIDLGTEEVASKEAWFHSRHSTWVVMPTPSRIAGAYGRDYYTAHTARSEPELFQHAWAVTVSSGLFMGRFLRRPDEESDNESSDGDGHWSMNDEPEILDE